MQYSNPMLAIKVLSDLQERLNNSLKKTKDEKSISKNKKYNKSKKKV